MDDRTVSIARPKHHHRSAAWRAWAARPPRTRDHRGPAVFLLGVARSPVPEERLKSPSPSLTLVPLTWLGTAACVPGQCLVNRGPPGFLQALRRWLPTA